MQKEHFLDTIVQATEKRMQTVQESFTFPFHVALASAGLSYICEVKKASPSKGLIAPNFAPVEIAKEYEKAGAAAISVLTEPQFFLGSGEYLQDISAEIALPTLRKDFILHPYQIYEAKIWGASAVLLIAELLDAKHLLEYIALIEALGMSALVESHSYDMLQKSLDCGAKIIGVNNRNLKTFEVDIRTCLDLRKHVPTSALYVAESGISTREDIQLLEEHNIDAVLIGESLMRSNDKCKMLKSLRGLA